MGNIIPRTAAIHDIAGFGRCSLTVIIPVLSSMGIQVCPLPTAILSTHSGGFGEFLFHDFTDSMEEYASHWKDINLNFECIYSGFLGSERQIDIVLNFFNKFKNNEGQLIVVDPVMGDNGKLYKTYTMEMQNKMRLLVKNADIVTPNLTEACFLLDKPYPDKPVDIGEMKTLLRGISEMGPKTVVITGFEDEDGCYSNVAYSTLDDAFWRVKYDYIPVHYPGTGDIYTSVLIGGLLNGDSLPKALDRATQFLSLAVNTTYKHGTPEREGVLLEKLLSFLSKDMDTWSYHMF